jgi:hypothetical protein
MISPAIALLISALSACIGAGIAAAVLRSRPPQPSPDLHNEESQQRAQKLVQLRQEGDALRARAEHLGEQNQHLSKLLGLPTTQAPLAPRDLAPALEEFVAMKHVVQSTIISPEGFVLHGDERDPHVRSLAAATGIFFELDLWQMLDEVTLSDTLGQRLTLHHITNAQGETQYIVGTWSRATDAPRSAVARMRAHLGHPMTPTSTHTRKIELLDSAQITQGGAMARLVNQSPVASLLATTHDEELLFKQGTRLTMWPESTLARRCVRFFSHRQVQGCGEFDELMLRAGDDITLMQQNHTSDHNHLIVEAQLKGPVHVVPSDAMRHATTQMGWHLKPTQGDLSATSTQGLDGRRTPETQPAPAGVA